MRYLAILLLSWPAWGAPHFQAKMLEGKRVQKEAAQWNIGDWLTQKNKIAFWDHWLAMNRQATIYENILSASHSRYELQTTDASGVVTRRDGDSANYSLDFYVTIFNLFGEYEKTSHNQEAFGGGIGLRLFGTSSQSTTLTARTGWRKSTDFSTHEAWENTFAEGALQLYLMKFMGIHGKYRMIFPAESNLGNKLEGSRATGGVFFETMVFRVFADYYQEPLRYKDASGVITKKQREGYDAGIRLYF